MAMKIVGRERRKLRIRKKVQGTAERPRLSVFRSSKHIYAQVIDDATGNTLAHASTLSKDLKGTLEEEVQNVLDNISRILEDSKSSLDKVLKVTVILRDERDWERMNSVYKKFFPKEPPARTTFQSGIGASVEMDAIAYVL